MAPRVSAIVGERHFQDQRSDYLICVHVAERGLNNFFSAMHHEFRYCCAYCKTKGFLTTPYLKMVPKYVSNGYKNVMEFYDPVKATKARELKTRGRKPGDKRNNARIHVEKKIKIVYEDAE